MISKRVASLGANEVHLRNRLEASESQFQDDLDLSQPFDWNYCIAVRNPNTDSWTRLVDTFDSFEEADSRFAEVVNEEGGSAGRFEAGAPENSETGRQPKAF